MDNPLGKMRTVPLNADLYSDLICAENGFYQDISKRDPASDFTYRSDQINNISLRDRADR